MTCHFKYYEVVEIFKKLGFEFKNYTRFND